MSIVYGLLLFAVLVLILYATWRPSSGKKSRPAQNEPPSTGSAPRRPRR